MRFELIAAYTSTFSFSALPKERSGRCSDEDLGTVILANG
jgi:hypothetical protein